MKTFIAALVIVAASAAAVIAGGWQTDFEQTMATAKEQQKYVLLNFTGSDWCGWCKKQEAEVFQKEGFQNWANDNILLMKVDFPRKTKLPAAEQEQNRALQKKYKVTGFPTFVLLDSEGNAVWKQPGYIKGGVKGFISVLEGNMK